MTKQAIIEHTLQVIQQLPEDKAAEVSAFADFVMKRHEEHQLMQGIQQMTAIGQAFAFLNDEEDIYSESDIKEPYDG